MADKLPATISVAPVFTDGEQPSAAKLTSIGAQLRRATAQLEKAIGDIRDQSWPYSSLTPTTRLTLEYGRTPNADTELTGSQPRILGIANLARLVGPAANLNPKMLEATSVTETVPSGVYQFSTKYPMVSGTAVFSDAVVFATLVTAANLNTAGEYYVDYTMGQVSTHTVTNGGTITYTTRPYEWAGGANYTGATFNVIPDPNQTGATGAYKISITGPVSGKYTVTLPLCSKMQSDIDGDSVTLTAKDINFDTQLKLPRVLQNDMTAGETIPAGFLYLRNNTTNEVYQDATYEYLTSSTFKIYSVDLDDAIAAGDEFQVLTVGTDITTSIDDLRNKFATSRHDRTLGEQGIPASSIVEATAVAGGSGRFGPSEIPGNYFPQYLHRDGYRSGVDDTNGNDYNAMRGHLAIGRSAGSAGSYIGSAGETFKIMFGEVDGTAPEIYRDSNNDLILKGCGDSADDRVRVTGAEFIPEQGIMAPDGVLGLALKLYAITVVVDSTGSPSTTLTELAGKTIHAFQVMVRDEANSVWVNSGPSDFANYDWIAHLSTGDPAVITYSFGSSWADTTATARILVWYT